ncbi:kinase-like domain-containing protein [Xylaria bambusicola]|uniref:kinase-like domain-containing protein n=1 Tax=Xylaria bambusicola TaxID=326684 RepID=UPI0020084BA0|nr:kinase-like domain-containing protein [Xylaria bambusicola]KAI0512531.1 kinase-like domain-containing protein [Xylaria bambusicola]
MATPESFWERTLRSDGWFFQMYRRKNWPTHHLGRNTLRNFRHLWVNRQLPRPGRVRREPPLSRPPKRVPVLRARGNPNLHGPEPRRGKGRKSFREARKVFNSARTYFSEASPRLALVKALGYGGNGVVIKCHYRRDESTPVFTLVMKLSLHGWDAPEIYTEEKITEIFNRGAHFIQVIPRDRINFPPLEPHVIPTRRWEDTSESESDSGDESYGDEPTQKVKINATKTRRQKRAAMNPFVLARRHKEWVKRNSRLEDLEYDRETYRDDPYADPALQVNRKDFLLLEFVENGDLETLLARVNQQGTIIPNRVLWGFWLCLTQACLGMQYPPRKFHPGRHEDHPILRPDGLPDYDMTTTGKRVGDDLFEQEPAPRRRWAVKRIVHFDIDPKNILVGGLDAGARDNEHLLVPRLKLADFGLADPVKPNKSNQYYRNLRMRNKMGYYAPEQFGADWDYVKRPDDGLIREHGPELSEQPVAGNYGSHTNVWGIALTMWQLITGYEVPVSLPFQLSRVPQTQMPNHYCIGILTERQYDRVDRELRETVAKCLAHEPRYRPQPRTLVQQAKRGISKRFQGETDAYIRQWVQDVIFDPPPPPPRNMPQQGGGIAAASAPPGEQAQDDAASTVRGGSVP